MRKCKQCGSILASQEDELCSACCNITHEPDISINEPPIKLSGRFGGPLADKTSATTTQPAIKIGERSAIRESIAPNRVPLDQATAIAVKLMTELDQFVHRWEIAGSIRRKEPTIGDIDIVIIPSDRSGIRSKVASIDPSFYGGDIKLFFAYGGMKINLFSTNEDSWGATLLEATGPASYIVGLRMKVKKMGMKLSNAGLFDQAGNKLAGRTEDDIYNIIWAPDPHCIKCGGLGGGGGENKCPLCKGKPVGKRFKPPERRGD